MQLCLHRVAIHWDSHAGCVDAGTRVLIPSMLLAPPPLLCVTHPPTGQA
jgi:hypothetical protein